MKLFFISFILFISIFANAWELEGFAGATSTTYDDVKEANSSGASARAKINFYSQDRGIFMNINGRGISLFASELMLGYGWRTNSAWFFEGGVGGAVSAIYGTNIGFIAGSGYKLTSNLFVNFPIVIGGSGIYWSPYIGYSF
jgi:hypothetical protein